MARPEGPIDRIDGQQPASREGDRSLNKMVLVDRLTLPLLLWLLLRDLFQGRVRYDYVHASDAARRWTGRFNGCSWLGARWLPLNNLYQTDDPEVNHHFEVNLAVSRTFTTHLLQRVEHVLERCDPSHSPRQRAILRTNILKAWIVDGKTALYLAHYGLKQAERAGLPADCVEVVSPCAWLLRRFPELRTPFSVLTVRAPLLSECNLLDPGALRPFFYLARHLLNRRLSRRNDSVKPNPALLKKRIATTVCWPLTGEKPRNFSWWYGSRLSTTQQVALFERADLPLDREGAELLARMQIERLAIRPGAARRVHVAGRAEPPLIAFPPLPLSIFIQAWRLSLHALLQGPFARAVWRRAAWQGLRSADLGAIYRRCGVRGLFHYQEDGVDDQSLAMERIDGARFGFHWSCFDSPGGSTIRTHQVFFLWGRHDAKVALEGGSVTPHLLLSGCPLVDAYDDRFDAEAAAAAARLKAQGAVLTLAVFDTSLPSFRFYRFLFEWLLQEPRIGMVLKGKSSLFDEVLTDGLDGLVAEALATGRFERLDNRAFPTVAARVCDFALGMGSTSPVAVCAIEGHRVLHLDYEGLDKPCLRPYATFHALGPNRCAFRSPKAVQQALGSYLDDPEAYKDLGDASPVVDRLDPFRDGRSGERIGNYAADFLEALEAGLSRDEALKKATRRYAERWGRDKVIRGLDS